jgi:hypothetical protein
MEEFGWQEGRNYSVLFLWTEGHSDRVPEPDPPFGKDINHHASEPWAAARLECGHRVVGQLAKPHDVRLPAAHACFTVRGRPEDLALDTSNILLAT